MLLSCLFMFCIIKLIFPKTDCTVPFYWNENWTTKKLSSSSSQKKGSLTTNLQGIAQPLAVHHQPLLLGMLSSHLVEDLH